MPTKPICSTSRSSARPPRNGAILILVLIGILGSIYAVARQRAPKMTAEDMVTAPNDTRAHGVPLSEEQAGATGVKVPDQGGTAGGSMGQMPQSGGDNSGATRATPQLVEGKDGPEKPHPPSNYTTLPGIEISSFPLSTQTHILERANHMHCTCTCGMTLAECRNEDSTCRHSLAEVAALVGEEARKDIASGLIKD